MICIRNICLILFSICLSGTPYLGPSGTHVVFQEGQNLGFGPYRTNRVLQKSQLALLEQDSCSKRAKIPRVHARKTINGIQCAGTRSIFALLEHESCSRKANWQLLEHAVCYIMTHWPFRNTRNLVDFVYPARVSSLVASSSIVKSLIYLALYARYLFSRTHDKVSCIQYLTVRV